MSLDSKRPEVVQWCLRSRISLIVVVHILGPDNIKPLLSSSQESSSVGVLHRMLSGPQGDFPSFQCLGTTYSRPVHHLAEQQGQGILFSPPILILATRARCD